MKSIMYVTVSVLLIDWVGCMLFNLIFGLGDKCSTLRTGYCGKLFKTFLVQYVLFSTEK